MPFSNAFLKSIFIVIIIIISGYYISGFIKIKEDNLKLKNFFNVEKIDSVKNYSDSYISILEIPKINLKKGMYEINSKFNDVDKNIEINSKSNMPDTEKGNFILEAHSGLSLTSYFNNLEKLTKNDIVNVYYNNIKYIYLIDNFYDIDKTGKAIIKRAYNKNTITLITCKKNENKQIIYIGYLKEKKTY